MIFFTSDQHFNHTNIILYSSRPYSSVEEMNEALVSNFNDRVSSTDTTYHLGDFSLQEKMVPLFLPRLNGTHILIEGNHDILHPAHRSHRKSQYQKRDASVEAAVKRYIDYGFKEVHLELEYEEFLLAHMPYELLDRHDKYDAWRPTRHGNRILLHGHVHNAWKYKADPPQLNCGVDVWSYAPVSIDEIRTFLASNPEDC
jgi:calcineurin-like phosphoesterase family protein